MQNLYRIAEPFTREADGLFYFVVNTNMRFDEAKDCCTKTGFRLPIIKSQESLAAARKAKGLKLFELCIK